MIPALGQHCHVDDDADVARRIIGKDGLAGVGRQIAVDQRRRDPRRAEGFGDVFGMGDGGTEDDGLGVPAFSFQ